MKSGPLFKQNMQTVCRQKPQHDVQGAQGLQLLWNDISLDPQSLKSCPSGQTELSDLVKKGYNCKNFGAEMGGCAGMTGSVVL